MAADDDVLAVLRSIDATLKALLALSQHRTAQARASQPKAVASDRDLDGQYGDPIVKFNPRGWNGPSCKTLPMSACPPEFLDMLAETFDYFAGQAEAKDERTNAGKPVADYKRRDAALARGWAKRTREGAHTQQPSPEFAQDADAGADAGADPAWAGDGGGW